VLNADAHVRAVRLLHFTDTHLFGDPDARLRGVATTTSLRACVEHARREALPADAILVSGDVVHDDPGGYGALELLLAPLDAPALIVAGNHDLPAEMHRQLDRAPFQTRGVFKTGNWRVLLLESWFAASAEGEGRLGDAALSELDAELARHRDAYVLLCLHHPPLLMDAPDLDSLRLADAEPFRALVARHPQVRAVTWGHAHQALDVLRDGVRWMCTPSTCFQFRTRAPGFASDARAPGYRVLDLAADGGLATEVVWLRDGWQS
jgi:Icc protein